MTSPDPLSVADAARAWVIRVRDPDFADWDGFTAWLERDPAHAAAYDAAADADDWVEPLFAAPPPLKMPEPGDRVAPARPSRRWFVIGGGGAIAASLALLVVGTGDQAGDPYSLATAPGERRTVELAAGTRIHLNGDSRLTLDRARPRHAVIERGEALFEVAHDDDAPFTVDVAGARLVDLGTVFNVASGEGALRVAVSEGVVLYNPDAEAIRMEAGDGVEVRGGRVARRKFAPEAVGAWRRGTLVYADAPMRLVAGDLSRNLGVAVTVGPAIAERRFTGTLSVAGDAAQVLPRVAPALGVAVRREGQRWVLDGDRARR